MSEDLFRRARRTFLARAGTIVAAFGGALAASPSMAQSQPTAPRGAGWQPLRHTEDDWLDQLPGKHRLFFDALTADGFGQAIAFASAYLHANESEYGLKNEDLAVIICARFQAAKFAYTDAIWAKYGATLVAQSGFNDPKTKQPPTVNVYQSTEYGMVLRNRGITLDAIVKRGVHFAVCRLATRSYAEAIAERTGGKADDIYRELVSNLVGNAHMVAAGILAVNRAQERGYSFAYVG